MNLLLAAAAVLTLALAGVGILQFVWPAIRQAPVPARLGLGYCMGGFWVSALFFLAYLTSFPFSRGLVLAPVIVLAIAGLPVLRNGWARPRWSLAGCLAVLLVLLALALSWSRPVYGYDALSIWALRAKVAYFAKTWPSTLFDSHTSVHPDYPPLIPSVQTYVFFYLDRFDDIASRTVFAAFFASGAAILWWWMGLLRASSRGVWLLWWCAVPVLMDQVRIDYADLPLAVYLMIYFGALVSWLRQPQKRGWLWLAALFGGIAFWVKQDAWLGIGAGFLAQLFVAWRRPVADGRRSGGHRHFGGSRDAVEMVAVGTAIPNRFRHPRSALDSTIFPDFPYDVSLRFPRRQLRFFLATGDRDARAPARRGASGVPEDTVVRVAILGKPNTGKSSLANRLLGEERSIVSAVPGTTRDVVEGTFEHKGRSLRILDTAGIRRKSRVTDPVEYYSVNRAIESIGRADIVVPDDGRLPGHRGPGQEDRGAGGEGGTGRRARPRASGTCRRTRRSSGKRCAIWCGSSSPCSASLPSSPSPRSPATASGLSWTPPWRSGSSCTRGWAPAG